MIEACKRDLDLAASLLDQCEELIEDFIRDNVDMDLDPDDMYEQYEVCRQYIRQNLFKDTI